MAKPLDLALEEHLLKARIEYVSQLKLALLDPDSLLGLTVKAYTSIIDEIVEDIAHEVAGHVTLGLDDTWQPRNVQAHRDAVPLLPPRGPSEDVFGVPINAMPIHPVACSNCARRVSASRFAAHLDKCLGNGRVAAGRTGPER